MIWQMMTGYGTVKRTDEDREYGDWESMLKTCAMAEDYHDKVAIQVINTIQSFQQRAVLIQYVADSNNNWHS